MGVGPSFVALESRNEVERGDTVKSDFLASVPVMGCPPAAPPGPPW